MKSLVANEVADFYTHSSENDRLKFGLGPLEWERNIDIITRYLLEGDKIADIGGGPGAYAEYLSNQSYEVHLIEPLPKHISQAEKRNKKLKNPFTIELAEAQNLPYEDNVFDLSILHGPLYHLQNESERLNALKEAKRVTKINGKILCYAINNTASTIVALLQGLLTEKEIESMCLSELSTGIHNAPKNKQGMLDGAFYHSPEKLTMEVRQAGLKIIDVIAVEGSIWLNKNYFTDMGNAEKRKTLMNFLKSTETHQDLLALSPHFVVVAEN